MTITLTREEAQQVLDALENSAGLTVRDAVQRVSEIKTIRARLAQPEPEPCNWVVDESADGNLTMSWMLALPMNVGTKLYTAPPQREWQGLTDEEITLIGMTHQSLHQVARAIEAKLKEKNT